MDWVLILVVLTDLKLLASSRLGAAIRVVALQGMAFGLLPGLAWRRRPLCSSKRACYWMCLSRCS
jgi:hypothetical protein